MSSSTGNESRFFHQPRIVTTNKSRPDFLASIHHIHDEHNRIFQFDIVQLPERVDRYALRPWEFGFLAEIRRCHSQCQCVPDDDV